jgi:hypothetical protein
MPITIKISKTSKIEKITGDKTQNHDHVIFPKSFNVINTIVRSPANPIPPDEEDD